MTNLDHQVWKIIKDKGLADQKILIGLSGGLDSVVLLSVLYRVHFGKIMAAHFHHGSSINQEFRDNALKFCQEKCKKNGIDFISEQADGVLNSEAQMRDARMAFFQKVSFNHKISILSLAHHQDDLLETRLLRLIRGTGPQGLIGMRTISSISPGYQIFRPFLSFSKKEILNYALETGLSYLEDPTNQETDYLRNWLREAWLPQLEDRQPGSLNRMSSSLQHIAEYVENQEDMDDLSKVNFKEGISRIYLRSLSRTDQLRILARYLLELNHRDFSQGQLEEVRKRLDNHQNELRFTVAGLVWIVNALQIKVES